MTILDIERLCVHRFKADARQCREKLFYGMEQVYQDLLVARIPCDMVVDGSFLTEKPRPDDVDIKVYIDYEAHLLLAEAQLVVYDGLNDHAYTSNLDISAWVTYPRGHPVFGSALDLRNSGEDYGLEHSEEWLKGYAAVMLWETDVGIRIRR